MLGNKIQKLRKEKGFSQEELASKLTISRQAISKWELGESMPDTENVVQLSKLFGVSLDYLLNDEYECENDVPTITKSGEKAEDDAVEQAAVEVAEQSEDKASRRSEDDLPKQEHYELSNQNELATPLSKSLKGSVRSPVLWILIAALGIAALGIAVLLCIILFTRQPSDVGMSQVTPESPVTTVQPPESPLPDVRTTIMYADRPVTDFTMEVGEKVPLSVRIEPVGAEGDILWHSSDPEILDIVLSKTTGSVVIVTAKDRGTVTLSVSVDGVEVAECNVRIRHGRNDPDVEDAPSERPASEVQSVVLTYRGRPINDITLHVGERFTLGIEVEPDVVDEQFTFIKSDSDVFDIVYTHPLNIEATITATGRGTATLTVYVGEASAECIIRVR